MSVRLPSAFISNNAGEIAAILITVQTVPKDMALEIRTDSQYVIDQLTKNLGKIEDNGWVGVENAPLLGALVATLRIFSAKTLLAKVKGHSGEKGNDEADAKANKGVKKSLATALNLQIPPNLIVTGMKLSTATQSIVYKGIISRAIKKNCWNTDIMLDRVKEFVKDWTNHSPTDEHIWSVLGNKNIRRNVKNFIWRGLHDSLWTGRWWLNINGFERRAECFKCDTIESLEHILTECTASGQKEIWGIAEKLWNKSGHKWPEMTLGTIMGCSLANYKDTSGKPDTGANRRFMILVSESSFLIWKIRCEWRISQGSDLSKIPTHTEVVSKWVQTIGWCIHLDILSTDTKCYRRQATSIKVLEQAWNKILSSDNIKGLQFTDITRVLVGIRVWQPP